jgi:quercetin dioxygenase-like cupin family protein
MVQSKYYEWLFLMVRIEIHSGREEESVRTKRIRIAIGLAGIVCAVAALMITGSASMQQDKGPRSKTAFTGKLPVLDGQHLTATLVEVTYPPGGVNTPHRHPCPVIGYVLEGAVRMQLKGREEQIYKAGDTFFESPTDVHAVSANASQEEPARFLAYFVCDRETPLSVRVTEGRGQK